MKSILRRELKEILGNISEEEVSDKSATIAKTVSELDEFKSSSVIMIYLSIPGEVDTSAIAINAWAGAQTVVAPIACPDTRDMRPVVCPDGDVELLHPGHGLRQPANAHPVDIGEIDMVIVPALAFDDRCNRLGRGGGFYDRFLANPELDAVCVGVCFTEQIVDELPINDYDRSVDIVVTDRSAYYA